VKSAAKRRHFGKAIPAVCAALSFRTSASIVHVLRVSRRTRSCGLTLDVDDVAREARHCGGRFSQCAAGRWRASEVCLERVSRAMRAALAPEIPGIALEVARWKKRRVCAAGRGRAEGCWVYRKRTTARRMPRRIAPGRRRISIGGSRAPSVRMRRVSAHRGRRAVWAGCGLAGAKSARWPRTWKYLLRKCWKAQLRELPRLRRAPARGAAGGAQRSRFIQALCALRLCFPQVGIAFHPRDAGAARCAAAAGRHHDERGLAH